MGAADESLIYRELMRFRPQDLSPNAWAVKAGVSRAVWSDMRRHGNPSRRTLEKLLIAVGSSLAEFEALRVGSSAIPDRGAEARLGDTTRAWRPAQLPPLPVVGSSLAGEWGKAGSRIGLTQVRDDELIDRVPRPVTLADHAQAYALTVVTDAMWPRFRPGRRIAVSPLLPVAIGDDVLLRLRRGASTEPGEGALALIAELVARTNGFLELRQFNPDVTFRVDNSEIEAVHRIAGELF